jgi:hypothetical protein
MNFLQSFISEDKKYILKKEIYVDKSNLMDVNIFPL